MKILITGGAGFIGSHVADAYLKAGHRVAVLDSLLTGSRRNLDSRVRFYKADIRDIGAVRRIIQREKPEILSHHAAIAEVAKSLANPLPTYETNVLGTANIALAFGELRGAKRKLIFASTGGAIYGEPRRIPAPESTAAVPLSAYGLSKQLGEEIVKFHARQGGFDFTIFRYANVYGPRQNPKGEAGVVAIFGGLMKSGEWPVIFGDGKKTRDYVYVEDIARANVLALRRGGGETLNLGWGRQVSDREIFEAVADAAGFSGAPRFAPHRAGEVRRIALDARRAKKILNWTPRTELRQGVRIAVKSI